MTFLERLPQILFALPPVLAVVVGGISSLGVIGNKRVWKIQKRGLLYLLRSILLGVETLTIGYISVFMILNLIFRFTSVLQQQNLFWISVVVGLWVGCAFALYHTSTQRQSPQQMQYQDEDMHAQEIAAAKFFDYAPFIQVPLYIVISGVITYIVGQFIFLIIANR